MYVSKIINVRPPTHANPSVYSAALRGGCCVPPCEADVLLIARYVSNLINGHYYYYRMRQSTFCFRLPSAIIADSQLFA